MHKKGFKYFEKILARNLEPKWETIVKEICDSPIIITLNGKNLERPDRWTLKALHLCYNYVMFWMCTDNAAKCNTWYMSTTVKITWPQVLIQQGTVRLEELNDISS